MQRFLNRIEAGQRLAVALEAYQLQPTAMICGLARGGVVVAHEIATALNLPLEVLVVRKLGAPFQPELALGAIASGGGRVLNRTLIGSLGISQAELERIEAQERAELERRERVYRKNRPFPELQGREVILVDDGLATGATMRAAIASVQKHHPARIVVAVPVAPIEARQTFEREAIELVTLLEPLNFVAVGLWYEQFLQVSDAEVCAALE